MKVGLLMLVAGLSLVAYTYRSYVKTNQQLVQVKKEDLVSYYLDLAWHLYPIPFWSGVIGMVTTVIAVLVLLIHIPLTF